MHLRGDDVIANRHGLVGPFQGAYGRREAHGAGVGGRQHLAARADRQRAAAQILFAASSMSVSSDTCKGSCSTCCVI